MTKKAQGTDSSAKGTKMKEHGADYSSSAHKEIILFDSAIRNVVVK